MTIPYQTRFGSLASHEKGRVESIADDVRHYAFSNCFEIASRSSPYERVVLGQNQNYVLEVARAEGASPWTTAAHDEFALVMHGEVEVHLVQLDRAQQAPAGHEGAVPVRGEPRGARMGWMKLRRGHQALLPAHSARQFRAASPGVLVIQTCKGELSVQKWGDICQTHSWWGALRLPHPTRIKRNTSMNAPFELAQVLHAPQQDDLGYRSFSLGSFRFSRDQYFAHIRWTTREGRPLSHTMDVGNFLRALMRDVAWGFFYGWVNFDHVIGTVNRYESVDLYAGSFNGTMKEAGVDLLENFPAGTIRETFEQMLDDWTNAGFDPFAAPQETGTPYGRKNGQNRPAITRQRELAVRCVGLPGDLPLRSDARGAPVNRAFADVPQDAPQLHPEPGFEHQVHAFNLFAFLSRSQVTWNPSFTSVVKDSFMCPTTEEHILPVIHGNDRVEWLFLLSDEIHWDCADKNTGKPLARVIMKAGDIVAMPAYCRHQGSSPKRSMLMVWENGSESLVEENASGRAREVPVRF